MLHDAGVKAVDLALDGPALRVEAAVADAGEARHHTAQAGHREAAFPGFFFGVAERGDLWVDQHRLGHGRRIGVTIVVPESENHHRQVDPDLRRRQACAVGIVHRVEQIDDECLQRRRIEDLHGLRDAQQARVAHLENFADGHGGCGEQRPRHCHAFCGSLPLLEVAHRPSLADHCSQA